MMKNFSLMSTTVQTVGAYASSLFFVWNWHNTPNLHNRMAFKRSEETLSDIKKEKRYFILVSVEGALKQTANFATRGMHGFLRNNVNSNPTVSN